jgi:hypothetical protein
MASDGAIDDSVLTCDEILHPPPPDTHSGTAARATEKMKRKREDEEDPSDEADATARLIAERRAKAPQAVELANRALDALIDLETMMAPNDAEEEDDDGAPAALFAEREERHFLLDAQRVVIDIRERALDYMGERPPNSPNC